MKYTTHLRSITFVLFVAVLICGCNTKSKEENEAEIDSAALANPAQKELNSDQSALLKSMLGASTGGVIRGISFGDPITKVKATESFEMFEDTPDHLGYTFETTQLETIDIQYFLTPDKRVNRITIDVYLNSPEATRELWNAGKGYFTEQYDQPKEEPKIIIWNKKSVRVNMEDVSVGKDYGLKFQFFPTDKNVLAAQ